jgi:hypothetical protein
LTVQLPTARSRSIDIEPDSVDTPAP